MKGFRLFTRPVLSFVLQMYISGRKALSPFHPTSRFGETLRPVRTKTGTPFQPGKSLQMPQEQTKGPFVFSKWYLE